MISKYDYEDLRNAAAKHNASQGDINRLGEWFSSYGTVYWNGEYYDADGFHLYPVEEWDEENEQGKTVGYEIR